MSEAEIRPGVFLVYGNETMRNAKGGFEPIETVKPQRKLEDGLVRDLFAKAKVLAEEMAVFKAETFAEVEAFQDILGSLYKAKAGGQKGNVTLSTFDGKMQIKIQVADRIKFGPELHAAQAKVEECLTEWSAASRPEVRAIITDAFCADKEGEVQRAKLIGLLRLDIQDERWQDAMRALKDSIEVVGSARYQRFYWRPKPTDKWRSLSLDMATVPDIPPTKASS